MLTLIAGENIYAATGAIKKIADDFGVAPERLDGSEVEPNQLPDIFVGSSLFSSRRLVVINELSSNKESWQAVVNWVDKTDDSTHIVLVEPRPDKRTKTYKSIQKVAKIIPAEPLGQRDESKAAAWLTGLAKKHSIDLSQDQINKMIRRALTPTDKPGAYWIDQATLEKVIEAFSALDQVTDNHIDAMLPPSNQESIFELFAAAFSGDMGRINQMVDTLRTTEVPQQVMGLLAGQVYQLAGLVFSGDRPEDVAREIGANAFVMGKLAPIASRLTNRDMRRIIEVYAEADTKMKSSATDLWDIIWSALVKTAKN